ncbi:glycosyltransferase family 2 protein [Microbacterium sp. NPDC089695]|uniref:glycosyltransferase family 2 protein n=1 Tax=Microbacterium sp. NPDC089695 TaxID=3364198 RepID=UPI0037FDCE96
MTPVVSAISTILVISFLTYVGFILVPYLRRTKAAPGDSTRFDWHLFVPCRDEEAVVATTVERARERFPRAHLWVIDDDSDDETANIVARYAAVDSHVHLVQRRRPQARIGKGEALNAAYAALNHWLPAGTDRSATIVAVVDADGEMAGNALDAVSADDAFGNPRVGAVQISVWMKNRADRTPLPGKGRLRNAFARFLIRMQDLEFRTVIVGMQSLRAKTGTVGLGGNGQFTRLSVLDDIAAGYEAPWHGSLLEDYELGVHVLLAGYENRHVDETYVAQEALPSLRRLLTQRTRWSQGNIQCVKYVKDIVLSPRFDAGGVLESSYYLILPFVQLLGAGVWLVLLGEGVRAVVEGRAFAGGATEIAIAVILGFLFGVAPFAVWGPLYKVRCEPDATWPQAFLWGVGLWLYTLQLYITLVRAFARVVLRKGGWLKTRRNAEVDVTGPTAKEV